MSALLTLSGDPLALILAGAAFAVFVGFTVVAGIIQGGRERDE